MEKYTDKKGVSLIALAVVVIIIMLISGMVTYVSTDMIAESKKMAFIKDTDTVYNAVEEYYGVNGDIPIIEDGVAINFDEYKANFSDDKAASALTNEVEKNEDTNATFYEIDISKIGIDSIKYGAKKNAKDIYLVSNETHSVYYYSGCKIKGEYYFSNSSALNK